MLDYVALLKNIKQTYGAEKKAVIAVGGSYGGMLAAWMRMKFPHAVQGALAASAPIFYFKGADGAPETKYFDIITKDFGDTYPDERCSNGIQEAFMDFAAIKSNKALWEEFSTLFKTCHAVDSTQDIDNLYYHIENAFAYMAMTDYPDAANFLNPMPAWPVNASCEFFKNVPNLSEEEKEIRDGDATTLTTRQKLVFTALRDAVNVYFNYEKRMGYCMDTDDISATGSLDGDGWNVLQCN